MLVRARKVAVRSSADEPGGPLTHLLAALEKADREDYATIIELWATEDERRRRAQLQKLAVWIKSAYCDGVVPDPD